MRLHQSPIRRLLTFNRHALSVALNTVIAKFDGNAFCRLFNVKAALLGSDARFECDTKPGRYAVRAGAYRRFFYHKKQACKSYTHGVRGRAEEIGRDYLLAHVDFMHGDKVVDCGANIGDLRLYFSEKQLEIEYVGIEPSPLEFECLQENVFPDSVFNLGLWDSDGQLDFYLSSEGADSSLIKPAQFDTVIQVPTRRLADIVEGPIKLLKIEAEGAEPEVLKGAEPLLPQVAWISADVGYERGVDQESTLPAVVNYLLGQNFELIDVTHDRVVALFKNRAFAEAAHVG